MNNSLLFGSIAFIGGLSLVLVLTPLLINQLTKLNKLDIPNHRSSHIRPTPSSGGLVFFPFIVFALLYFLKIDFTLSVLCMLMLLSGVLGWIDDRRDVSPKIKLIVQLLIAFGIKSAGLSLQQVLLQIGISVELPILDYILTTLLIIAFMNAFNLIDGIDGLAGGVAFLSALVFSFIFYQLGDWPFFILTIGVSASVLGFLMFNFQPAKIFMGDTGSLLLGCFLICCFFRSNMHPSNYLLLSVSTLIYPFLDMIRLFLGRILLHRTPFGADQNHYHHLLLVNGFNHKKSALTIYIIHLSIMTTSLLLSNYLAFLPSFLILSVLSLSTFIFMQFLFAKTLLGRHSEIVKSINNYRKANHLIKKHLS